MPSSVKELLAAANSSVPSISPQEAKALIESGKALAVDVRDGTEVQASGKVQGAKHVSRGMLEFRADPSSPYHLPDFDPAERVILFCASGGRSALGVLALKQLGYRNVAHLAGGLNAWMAEGHPTVPVAN